MLSFPLIETKDIDLATPLKVYISANHSIEDANLCAKPIEDVAQYRVKYYQSLRNNECLSTTRAQFVEYFTALRSMAKRFPFAGDNAPSAGLFSFGSSDNKRVVNIEFKYNDFFQGKAKSVESRNINFEIAMISLNYANLLTRQAADVFDKQIDAKINDACQMYKEASAVYKWLSEQPELTTPILSSLTPILSPEALNILALTIFAHTQVLFPQKAMLKKTSIGIVASLTSGSAKCFNDVLAAINAAPQPVKTYFTSGKNFSHLIEFQRAYHQATANLWYGKSQFDNDKYGDELAYLYCARTCVGQTTSFDTATLQFLPELVAERSQLATNINNRIVQAEKDNNTIYFSQIPTEVPLVPPKALATYGDFSAIADQIRDPFAMLVDPALREAVQKAHIDLDAVVTMIANGLQGLDAEANKELQAMGLPMALEVAEAPPVTPTTGHFDPAKLVPDDLWAKIYQIQVSGGIEVLQRTHDRSIQGSGYIGQKTKELIEMLKSEGIEDELMRKQFAGRWTRQASADLAAPFITTCEGIKSLAEEAQNADKLCHQEFAQLKQNFGAIITKDRSTLGATLPRPQPSTTPAPISPASQPHIQALRTVLNELYALFRERQERVGAARQFVLQLVDKARSGLGQVADKDAFIADLRKSLDEHLTPLHGDNQLAKQKDILQRMSIANRTFSMKQAQGSQAPGAQAQSVELQAALARLHAMVTDYQRVRKNLEEGDKFYKDLVTDSLTPVAQKIADFIAARNLEKNMHRDDLTKAMSAMSIQPQQQQRPIQTQAQPQPQQPYQQYGGYNNYPATPQQQPYGYPPAAAPAPQGYGYPPAAAPAPQGYGYPAAAPQGYGYPPAAAPQGYGYPQQPQYGAYPPGHNGYGR